jgi:hypothetical protein
MINLIWLLIVVLAVLSQFWIIEKKQKYPVKILWAAIRVAVAGVFMYFYIDLGYMWYWALLYMIGSFWGPFNLMLNFLRNKDLNYLSPKNSFVDRMLMKAFKDETIATLFIWFITVCGVGIMYFYGTTSWCELNPSLCH